jgi:hypothetical protein
VSGAIANAARLAVLALAASLLSACVFWTPALDARVVDAQTLAPIAGATVKASPTPWPLRSTTLTTNADGGVHVPELQFFAPAPGDPGLSVPVTLHIEALGFKPRDLEDLRPHDGPIQIPLDRLDPAAPQ